MVSRHILGVLVFGALFPVIGLAQAGPVAQPTIWTGVFQQAEAERGARLYEVHCSRCHGPDLGGYGGVLTGARFMERWREDNLQSLLKKLEDTMPPGPRGQVTRPEYVDIAAYLLRMNGFPAGDNMLETADLKGIPIVSKEGPQPVPDFSLVTVSGCLAPDGAKGWMMTDASEPVRTRNPGESTDAESAAALARARAAHTFHFLDTNAFSGELKASSWMEAKGFLMRSPGNDRINLTWLKILKPGCDIAR